MNPKKVCILGAGGSIGSRLVENFHSDEVEVTAVVRSLASAVRIGRFGIQIVPLDLLMSSCDELAEVLEGNDVVIDCTYSTNPDYDQCLREANELAQLICEASCKAKVSRLIHYGTISVYPTNLSSVDESIVCTPSGDKYGDSKLVSEGVFMENSTSSLAVTVLQLPIVFGPYMGWSISPVAQMNGQKLLMCEGLKGMCSPLYVDDVYKATLLALNCTESFGKRLLISDKPISWVSYYSGYSTMSETLELEVIPRDTFTELLADRAYSDTPFQRLKAKFAGDGDFRQLILSQFGVRSLYKIIKRYRGQDGVDKIKTNIEASLPVQGEPDESPLNQGLVDLFDSLPEVSSLKAKDVLKLEDYTPMAEALAETEEWLKWARLID